MRPGEVVLAAALAELFTRDALPDPGHGQVGEPDQVPVIDGDPACRRARSIAARNAADGSIATVWTRSRQAWDRASGSTKKRPSRAVFRRDPFLAQGK